MSFSNCYFLDGKCLDVETTIFVVVTHKRTDHVDFLHVLMSEAVQKWQKTLIRHILYCINSIGFEFCYEFCWILIRSHDKLSRYKYCYI